MKRYINFTGGSENVDFFIFSNIYVLFCSKVMSGQLNIVSDFWLISKTLAHPTHQMQFQARIIRPKLLESNDNVSCLDIKEEKMDDTTSKTGQKANFVCFLKQKIPHLFDNQGHQNSCETVIINEKKDLTGAAKYDLSSFSSAQMNAQTEEIDRS